MFSSLTPTTKSELLVPHNPHRCHSLFSYFTIYNLITPLCLSLSTLFVFDAVDQQTRPTPVKVIRHINGPTACISSCGDDPLCYVKSPDPVKTHGESSRHDPTSEKMSLRSELRGVAGNPVSEVMVRSAEDDGHSLEIYERKKVIDFTCINV